MVLTFSVAFAQLDQQQKDMEGALSEFSCGCFIILSALNQREMYLNTSKYSPRLN